MATATATARARKKHTGQGPDWWFAGYASGDLLTSNPTLLRNRWIYILERRDGVPVKLHLEVRADKDAKLSQVSGDLRRQMERTSPQVRPIPVPTVSLPYVVQDQTIRYYFFASPTRLTRRAIAALEFAMARPSPEWIDLSAPPASRLFFHDGRPPVVLVVDPLTVAAHLHSAYERVLDDSLHYVMPSEKTDARQAETIRARVLKYQLARLIALNLLPERRDPFNIRKELADAMGDQVYAFIEAFESQRTDADARVDGAAARLIAHFQSAPWELLARLHLFVPEDTATWLNLVGHCIERLSSCKRGIEFLGGLFSHPPPAFEAAGLASEGEERDLLPQAALIARKAAAGVTTVWAEVFPAAVVLKKVSVERALARMERVYRAVAERTTLAATMFTPGTMVAISYTRTTVEAPQLEKEVLKDDLQQIEKWTEDAEGRWPDETDGARTARTVTSVLRTFEIMNLALKLKALVDPNKDDHFEAACDVAGAVLDTAVAFDEALKPTFAKIFKSERLAGASLKFMGAVSSLIDVVLATQKLGESAREHKGDLEGGYEAARGASVVGVFGGILHTLIAAEVVKGPAAVSLGLAASALCLGAAGASIVISLYQEGQKRSVFQRCVNHSVFGERKDPRQGAEWARGEAFNRWHDGADGLGLQIQTLTYLFANFEVTGADASTIDIRLGATPPGARLKVTFLHGAHESGWLHARPAESSRAIALIDPFAAKASDALLQTEGEVIWQIRLDRDEQRGRTAGVRIGARPKSHQDLLEHCTCEVQLVFTSSEPGRDSAELLTIPPKEPLRYNLVEQGGGLNRSPKSTLPEAD